MAALRWLRALAWLAPVVLWAGCREPLSIRGVTLGLFDTSLSRQAVRAELEAIRELGANSVSVPVYWFQRDVTADEIGPYRAAGFDSSRFDDLTRTAIREARDAGLAVFLIPVVQLEHTGQGEWRGALRPHDWEAWFDSYERFLMHYAWLAEDEGVDLLSVGSELSSSERHESRWRSLIDGVRSVFSGELTYSANWDHYHVPFWDELDYVGVSGYYEVTAEAPATDAALRHGWRRLRQELEAWGRTIGKSLLFTEIGYPSLSTAAHAPWDYTSGQLDLDQQRRCYRAFIDAWRGSEILAGTYLWIWEPGRGGPADRGYAWRGKPAEVDIAAWYREG